jgi:hypothetical protein
VLILLLKGLKYRYGTTGTTYTLGGFIVNDQLLHTCDSECLTVSWNCPLLGGGDEGLPELVTGGRDGEVKIWDRRRKGTASNRVSRHLARFFFGRLRYGTSKIHQEQSANFLSFPLRNNSQFFSSLLLLCDTSSFFLFASHLPSL